MLASFEEREKGYNEVALEQEKLFAELDDLKEETDLYNEKVARINELGKTTGIF